MKVSIFIILIKLCILNDILTQNAKITFAKDVRIIVDNQISNRLSGATVKFITSEKTYYSKYVVDNQNYRFDSLPIINGTFKVSHPGYESQSRKAIPIDGGWQTNREYPFRFTLGKPGSAYTILDNRLNPYTPNDHGWAINYSQKDYDTVVQYLHQNGFVITERFNEVRVLIVCPYRNGLKIPENEKAPPKINKQSRDEQFVTLVNFNPIHAVGPLGSLDIYGRQIFLPNYIYIKFVPLTTPEEKQVIYDKYNLEFYKMGPNLSHTVKLKKNGHHINEIAVELLNEPIITHVSNHFGTFKLDSPDR